MLLQSCHQFIKQMVYARSISAKTSHASGRSLPAQHIALFNNKHTVGGSFGRHGSHHAGHAATHYYNVERFRLNGFHENRSSRSAPQRASPPDAFDTKTGQLSRFFQSAHAIWPRVVQSISGRSLAMKSTPMAANFFIKEASLTVHTPTPRPTARNSP